MPFRSVDSFSKIPRIPLVNLYIPHTLILPLNKQEMGYFNLFKIAAKFKWADSSFTPTLSFAQVQNFESNSVINCS